MSRKDYEFFFFPAFFSKKEKKASFKTASSCIIKGFAFYIINVIIAADIRQTTPCTKKEKKRKGSSIITYPFSFFIGS